MAVKKIASSCIVFFRNLYIRQSAQYNSRAKDLFKIYTSAKWTAKMQSFSLLYFMKKNNSITQLIT